MGFKKLFGKVTDKIEKKTENIKENRKEKQKATKIAEEEYLEFTNKVNDLLDKFEISNFDNFLMNFIFDKFGNLYSKNQSFTDLGVCNNRTLHTKNPQIRRYEHFRWVLEVEAKISVW